MLKKITFSIIMLIVALTAIEVVLRITHLFGAKPSWVKADPELGWTFVPNATYWYNEENPRPVTGKFNSFGWRDQEWNYHKPHDVYRIAVLGDSYVEALQVESDSTFLSLAEQILNRDQTFKKKFEFMNFGRSGCTQSEELIILKREIMAFSPDVVILCFLPGNDIRDVSQETAVGLMRPFYRVSEKNKNGLVCEMDFNRTAEFRFRSLLNILRQNSAFLSVLVERTNRLILKNQPLNKSTNKGQKGRPVNSHISLCTENPDSTYLQNYKLNKVLIKEMAEYCKASKVIFSLVCLDLDQAYIPEIEERIKALDTTFNVNFFEDDLDQYAEFVGIHYLGLQRIFRRYYEKSSLPLHWDWGHWNYDGHRLVARSISDELRRILMLSQSSLTRHKSN